MVGGPDDWNGAFVDPCMYSVEYPRFDLWKFWILIIFGMHVWSTHLKTKIAFFSPTVVTGLARTYAGWYWVAHTYLLKPQGWERSHNDMGSRAALLMSHHRSDIWVAQIQKCDGFCPLARGLDPRASNLSSSAQKLKIWYSHFPVGVWTHNAGYVWAPRGEQNPW